MWYIFVTCSYILSIFLFWESCNSFRVVPCVGGTRCIFFFSSYILFIFLHRTCYGSEFIASNLGQIQSPTTTTCKTWLFSFFLLWTLNFTSIDLSIYLSLSLIIVPRDYCLVVIISMFFLRHVDIILCFKSIFVGQKLCALVVDIVA